VPADAEHARAILAEAFATSRNAIIIFRARDEMIVDVNDAWCRTTGYAREQVVGRDQRTLDIWRDPHDSARLAAHLAEYGSVDGFEFAFTRRAADGGTEIGFAVLTAQPVTVDGEVYVVGVGRDVTREHRERETRERARRLEELGRLAGGVAHDFNNLLTVITSYAELLQADASSGEANPDDAVEIRRAAEAAGSLARRLVAFSRHQPVVPQRVDVGATVSAARRLLAPVVGERIALTLELADALPPVLADPGQVEQVLLNLVANARDAIVDAGGAGRIVVRTGHRVVDASEVRRLLGVEGAPGRYVTLAVEDTGAGIDEATLARIFEPFFTTKAPNAGTGLGLAVVHGIVRQAGGVVVAHSVPGRGSTFTTYWPEANGSAVAAPSEPAPRAADAGAARLLLVEDQPAVREIARRVLTRAGYEVVEAKDGDEALEVMARPGARFDLVLSDAVMPRMDGYALAQRLAASWPEVPILLMSGYLDTGEPLASLPNLRPRIVPKPFTSAVLLGAVRAALTGDDLAEVPR
jgi:PAS domain S-box-containing protein